MISARTAAEGKDKLDQLEDRHGAGVEAGERGAEVSSVSTPRKRRR